MLLANYASCDASRVARSAHQFRKDKQYRQEPLDMTGDL